MRECFAIWLATGSAVLLLSSCVESTSLAPGSAAISADPAAASEVDAAPAEKLTKHDAALRFLTAYIRLDRAMALKYASPQAVNKLDWNRPHRGNIPITENMVESDSG
ncbi:MAG: hypothetical protein AAF491_06970, partial [Verrucomicrobiota bacterium]